ncbi:exosome complex exonuclease MTR3 [Trichuris trichiura]|uniref:Exosome complex exonuclease MTR3 n=1 Tax=Trichuris trichiura TaxID=36087 RepID=A0A077YZU3_TRITR|nr:exosome complex exonuclease MTR3 [Trichuris trichiura]
METLEGKTVPYDQFESFPKTCSWNLPFPRLDKTQHFFVKCNIVPSAAGSAYIEVEKTKVMCFVIGPSKKLVNADGQGCSSTTGVLDVTVRYAPYAKPERIHRARRDSVLDEESKIKRFAQVALFPAVRLLRYPKRQIQLLINVLEDDGNALIAALNCSSLALASSKIQMFDLLISGTMSYPADNAEAATVTASFLPAVEQFCSVHIEGVLMESEFREALEKLKHTCKEMLYPAMRSELLDSLKNEEKRLEGHNKS